MVWLLTNNMLDKNQYQTKKMYIQGHVSNHCTLQTIIIRTIEQFNLTQKKPTQADKRLTQTATQQLIGILDRCTNLIAGVVDVLHSNVLIQYESKQASKQHNKTTKELKRRKRISKMTAQHNKKMTGHWMDNAHILDYYNAKQSWTAHENILLFFYHMVVNYIQLGTVLYLNCFVL